MSKVGKYILEGYDLYTSFGWFSKDRSSSDDLLRYPKSKEPESHDWQDSDGKEWYLDERYFDDATITLAGQMEAPNEDTFWSYYYNFRALLMQPGELSLYVEEYGKTFKVFYRENTKLHRRTRIKGANYICLDMDIQLQVITDLTPGTIPPALTKFLKAGYVAAGYVK
jgi:hypothetical protein